ncbi:MAG TPA: type II CAAX endopeptidase family protein [Tepidiformaceae bacterium]|nr:type II CAAX endopeptidase family protein [Tepidiformaceae bacterium]
MEETQHARPPWGPKFVFKVAGVYLGTFIGLQVLSLAVLALAGFDLDSIDNDSDALTILLAFSFLQQVGSIALAVWAVQLPVSTLVAGLGLDRWRWTWIWRPALMTVALYAMVAIWSIIMQLLGIDLLEPDSSVDESFVKGPLLIIVSFFVIVVGAPLSEEFTFRGAIFGGLLKWGFWPAALVSGVLFGAIHFDPGSFIPFSIVGVGLAYLYWSRGSLWDNIICHAMFNFTSFLILVGSR